MTTEKINDLSRADLISLITSKHPNEPAAKWRIKSIESLRRIVVVDNAIEDGQIEEEYSEAIF